MKINDLVAAVKAHALAHYEDGGWDVVVETYDDAEIAKVISKARTVRGAIANFADVVDVYAEREADAESYRDDEYPADQMDSYHNANTDAYGSPTDY